jgi:hypothetical protein
VNRFKQWFTPHGRPVYTKGPVFYLLLVWFLILTIGNGLALARIEHDRHADSVRSYIECQARNENATKARRFIEKLSSVGDKDERAFWQSYQSNVPNKVTCGEAP